MKSLVVFNPKAKNGKHNNLILKINNYIKANPLFCDLLISEYKGHITDYLIKNAINYDVFIIFGGDGTINEVVNGISLHLQTKIFKILVFPIGSGNDFVKNYCSNLSIDKIEPIFDKISRNNYRTIRADLGKLVVNQLENLKVEKYFINAVGFGFDAFVAFYKEKLKYFSGLTAYIVSVFFVLLNYYSFKVVFNVKSNKIEQESLLITIANGISSGGGFYLTPDAKIDDRLLDIGLVRYLRVLSIFIKIPLVLLNRTKKLVDDIKFFKVVDITLTFNKSVYCHIDGETVVFKINSATINNVPSSIDVIIIED